MKRIITLLIATAIMAVGGLTLTTTAEAKTHHPTYSERQAVGMAKDYLKYMPFSKKGLIQQLHSKYGSGFSTHDATYAVNHIKVSWKYQAYRSAKQYLKYMHFSRSGLIRQLTSRYGSQFTHSQAVYAVNKVHLR